MRPGRRAGAGDVFVRLDGLAITPAEALHQVLDDPRITMDCTLKLLRGMRSPQPRHLGARPADRTARMG